MQSHPDATFADALTAAPTRPEMTLRLRRALQQAERAVMEAKLALAAGDAEAASRALDQAADAQALAQELRASRGGVDADTKRQQKGPRAA